jgi:hypothetical protein
MTPLLEHLSRLTAYFERKNIVYALMGGLAVRLYGIPRPTYDLDFTIALDRNALPDLFHDLQTLGYTIPESYTRGWIDEVAGMPILKIQVYLEGRNLDVDVFLAESEYQQTLLSRRRHEMMEEGLFGWVVSLEDLILLKLIASRPRDLADVADILFLHGPLDEQYLRHWADRLKIRAELEKVLSQG